MTRVIKISRKNPDPRKIAQAAEVIRRGGLVAFPTETVYGLGANCFDRDAVAAIFGAKERPPDNPLIVHIADPSTLDDLAEGIPDAARRLSKRYWPGPLTLILKRKDAVPPEVSAGLPTVAVRMPAHPVALALIRAAGTPIAAPSANLSSRPSPTRARHVVEDLCGRIDLIIDGGMTQIGMESTVIDFTSGQPRILRPGAVSAEEIAGLIGSLSPCGDKSDHGSPKSPGMKYRHYAPRARVILAEGESFREDMSRLIVPSAAKTTAVITFDRHADYGSCRVVYAGGSPKAVARHLFRIFRDLDNSGAELILVEPYPIKEGEGEMIQDRLRKAAGADRAEGFNDWKDKIANHKEASMTERAAIAVAAMKEGMNCCQAIITTYGPPLGLPLDAAAKLGSAFGGGLGRTGEVCGALTGATMVLGMQYGPREAKNPAARERVYRLTRELLGEFKKRRGNVACSALLGCDISTEEGYSTARSKGLFKEFCPLLVQDAADILESITAREGST